MLTIQEDWVPIGAEDLWHARYRYCDRRTDGSVRTEAAAFRARAWDPATIRDVFSAAGLEITAIWGHLDRRPFRRDSPRLVVTARRAVQRRGLPEWASRT